MGECDGRPANHVNLFAFGAAKADIRIEGTSECGGHRGG